MAARLRQTHQEDVKSKIQASQLVNLLQDHALGIKTGDIQASRIDAAKFLLNKVLSNAPTITENDTHLNANVDAVVEMHIVDPKG